MLMRYTCWLGNRLPSGRNVRNLRNLMIVFRETKEEMIVEVGSSRTIDGCSVLQQPDGLGLLPSRHIAMKIEKLLAVKH